MKKLICSMVAAAVCMLAVQSAVAQDIIRTMDSEVIEAVVIEINDTQVVYKAYDNPDGPVYKMSVAKISKITFANGTEEIFENARPFVPVLEAGPVPYGNMLYDKGAIYLDGRQLTYSDMQACMSLDLYKQASGGLRMRNSGKKLMIAGGVITGVSIIFMIAGTAAAANNIYYDSYGYAHSEPSPGAAFAVITGAVCIFPGVACLSAGIPLYCVGQSRARRASATYNSRAQVNQLTLNVGAARNGFGLYLAF